MLNQPAGPTLLGFDVIWIATILSAVATMAVLVAIYAATTARDPMARRVKALNERREQLKAGIVASTNKRKKLTNKNAAADKVRGFLAQFKDRSQVDPDAFRDLYAIKVTDPFNFGPPRTIRLGVRFDF